MNGDEKGVGKRIVVRILIVHVAAREVERVAIADAGEGAGRIAEQVRKVVREEILRVDHGGVDGVLFVLAQARPVVIDVEREIAHLVVRRVKIGFVRFHRVVQILYPVARHAERALEVLVFVGERAGARCPLRLGVLVEDGAVDDGA